MDFQLSEDQEAIRDLAARILGDHVSPERLRELERAGTWWATDAWAALAGAGLLGLALPEAHGGAGLGLVEACLVAEQVGRHVAPMPYLHSTAAALAVARFGTDLHQRSYLPGVATGDTVLSVALHEGHEAVPPAVPATVGTETEGGWRLQGEKALVPSVDDAAAVLVPARTADPDEVSVFVVDPRAAGVELIESRAVHGEPQWTLRLDDVEVAPDARLGGDEVRRHLLAHLTALLCAAQTGVCEGALRITAAHVSQREQFGARLGTFQAVAQRMADAYIDTEAVRLTALQAAWRVDAGLEATDELLIAKFWSAEGAQRVVHAAQHLHGGIGVDTDHPVHRYFRWAKVLELTLGGATASLLQLGTRLADRPAVA